jgi:CRP-like cAMP-binding protein
MITEEILTTLLDGSIKKHIRKGEVLLNSGDSIDRAWFLSRGIIKSSIQTPSGNSYVLNLYTQGSFIPMSQLFTGVNITPYSFTAVTACDVVEYKTKALLTQIKHSNELLFEFCTKFAFGLEGLARRLDLILDASAQQKVAIAFLLLMEKFGEILQNGTILIRYTHTHQDIAEIAGVSRETATKMLLTIEREGILLNERKTTLILKPSELKVIAGIHSDEIGMYIL